MIPHTIKRPLNHLLLATLLLPFVCSAAYAQNHSQRDLQLAEALRIRRLFQLAESFCLNQLESDQLSPRTAALLTIQRIQIEIDLAYQSPTSEQAIHWDAAQRIANDFRNANPTHAFLPLIEVQQSLTTLASGILLRQQFQAFPTEAVNRQTMQQIRSAARDLDRVERLIVDARTKNLVSAKYGEGLSDQELAALENNILFHRAEVFLNRALLHGQDDQLNRIDALGRVATKLTELLERLEPEDPLRAKVLINLLNCFRLQEDYPRATELMARIGRELNLQAGNVRGSFAQDLEACVLRIAIARFATGGDHDTLKRMLLEGIENESAPLQTNADLMLARIEGLLALAAAISNAQTEAGEVPANASRYQQQAVKLTDLLQSRHGRYWSRRASLLLVKSAGANPQSADVTLLTRIADATFLKGELDDAVRAYEAAAKHAADPETRFDLLYKAAAIQHQRRDFTDSTRRFQKLAIDYAAQVRAPAAHLLAIVGTSELARQDSTKLKGYVELLQNQITSWPNAAETDQARIWYSAIQHHQDNVLNAIEILLDVPPDSPYFSEAMHIVWNRGRGLPVRLKDDQDRRSAIAAFAELYKRAFSSSNPAPTEAELWAMAVSAEMLGRLDVPIREMDIQRLATTNGLDAALDWNLNTAVQSVLVQQYARVSDVEKFTDSLNRLLKQDPTNAVSAIEQVVARKPLNPKIASVLRDAAESMTVSNAKLDKSSLTTLLLVKARTFDAVGDTKSAIQQYDKLLADQPRNTTIRIEYATLMIDSDQQSLIEKGLDQWRMIVKLSQPRSDQWYLAKLNVARALHRSGQFQKAHDLLSYLKEVPPGWQDSSLRDDFEQLLQTTMKRTEQLP